MAHINKQGKLIYNEITSNLVIQANYLASMQDEYWIDDGINIYTGVMPWNWGTPPCSHTEIGFWFDGELWFFSSTSRKELGSSSNKKNGTRWVKASVLLRNPTRWLIQEKTTMVHQGSDNIEDKVGRANRLSGLLYDFPGVGLDFTNPVRVFNPQILTPNVINKLKKIYCSKAVHVVDTGILVVFSPKRRYKYASNHSYRKIDTITEAWMMRKGII